ncbi:MAG: anthranilate phosphoribosyltransferase family protein [Cyanobacteria bacterium P01_E01_bin.6]
MSNRFRDLLRKVGSGHHTSEHLTREESAEAARMMLTQEATPAQIGAFMISHRIKRPTGEELAGMLDAYQELGPALTPITADYPTLVMNSPYDGRSRTSPLSPITALILATKQCPVILHGGERMPTKYGLPLIDIWKAMGVDWAQASLEDVQHVFEKTLLGFVYLPRHFPLAQGLVPYRDQLGKRPPQATLELMWCPYQGEALMICGFVHPPTEKMIRTAVSLHRPQPFLAVKGLEGSCDLPRDRTCIIGLGTQATSRQALDRPQSATSQSEQTRSQQPESGNSLDDHHLFLHPRDYGFGGKDVPFDSDAQVFRDIHAVLQGEASDLMTSAIWNGGFYLWQSGVCSTLETGLSEAENVLVSGAGLKTLQSLQTALSDVKETRTSTFIGAS